MTNVVQGLIISISSIMLWNYSARYIDHRLDILGPAFLPRMVAVCGFVMGIIIISRKFRKYKVAEESVNDLPKWKEYTKILVPIAAIVSLCLIFFEQLGFVLFAVVLLFSTSYFLGERNIKRLAIYSISMSVGMYIVFNKLLKIGLPDGFIMNLFQ